MSTAFTTAIIARKCVFIKAGTIISVRLRENVSIYQTQRVRETSSYTLLGKIAKR